jgi:hypothetical protein
VPPDALVDSLVMSVLEVGLLIVAALLVVVALFFVGGLVYSRRRLNDPDLERHIAGADQELEAARASDRGWDRELLEAAARRALGQERPEFEVERLHLVLVDDRPGVEEDRAHVLAIGGRGQARVVLTRDSSGAWMHERIE